MAVNIKAIGEILEPGVRNFVYNNPEITALVLELFGCISDNKCKELEEDKCENYWGA